MPQRRTHIVRTARVLRTAHKLYQTCRGRGNYHRYMNPTERRRSSACLWQFYWWVWISGWKQVHASHDVVHVLAGGKSLKQSSTDLLGPNALRLTPNVIPNAMIDSFITHWHSTVPYRVVVVVHVDGMRSCLRTAATNWPVVLPPDGTWV
jgi:hypothetical protein